MTAPARDAAVDQVPVARSLLARTTAVLGLALALAAVVLIVLFRPYLSVEFEAQSGELLRDQAVRARSAARVDAEVTSALLRTSVGHALGSSRAEVDDLPLALVTPDHERVRDLARSRLDVLRAASERKLDAVVEELSARTEQRLRADEKVVAERNAQRAEKFGADLSRRAAALLVALVGALFLLHGFLLYRTVLAPVRRLSEATDDVARGRLDTRIPVAGDDEVARLAGSFNSMTASLAETRGELEQLNQELEGRVRAKTAQLREALAESREANRRLEAAMQELREKEKELRHAEKMASLGTLAGGVAHEFNNLLGGILGCAEEGAREEDPGELRETLTMIERTARRGTAITANLLRFARPGSAGVERVDVAELLSDVADLVDHEAERLDVEVLHDVGTDVDVRGEASGLHQVLLNLATNALHAMRERGGTLTLSAERAGDEIQIAVADTGPGVPEEHRGRLFEPFFTTRGPEGTGLGLSVSYGIVRAHRGRIEIESEPGRGATFRILLPAVTRGGET